ncbi:integrase [Synechococcus sp. Lug-A]|uniref:integrase n=1 Tax=Synechococcus sp. Lug-A TaxID=2823740 RepID=UPI0020CE5BA6|nr:integrase [Synechococcus sp. Lug-A]
MEQARKLAEELGRDVELHRMGLDPFPFDRWFAGPNTSTRDAGDAISGLEAIRRTEQWWNHQRRRGVSAPVSWATDYASPLKPLLSLGKIDLNVLTALVESKEVGSRNRRRASIAAVAVARAIELGPDAVLKLKDLGKGYTPQKDAAPRELPTDAVIVEVIDALPADWQWVAGVCATYGTRPHEALMKSQVLSNGLVAIVGGKTGARQGLPLPKIWIDRWSLERRRLPGIKLDRDHRTVGAQLGVALRRFGAPFKAYDLRHAWAVRAIHNPQISPSLAAKSLGHSLMVHTSLYQRWFDSASMASLVAQM